MSAPKRPQKAKGPGICSGPQLGVASRDPGILSSYGRAYPWQALVDRQQRQAARPQRMRDIRSPLCRVGCEAVKKRAPIRIPHLSRHFATQCERRPNPTVVRGFGSAKARRLVRRFGGRFQGRFEGMRFVTSAPFRTFGPQRFGRHLGSSAVSPCALVDRLVPSCYRRRVNSRATACYCCACPCEPGDAGPMGERRE